MTNESDVRVRVGSPSLFCYKLVPKPTLSSGPRVPAMEQLRAKRSFVRRAITKAISTIDALLSDWATPVRVLHHHLELVFAKQAELVEFDRAMQETRTDAVLEAELTAFEYEQKKALPPELSSILYRQRLKEASLSNHDDTAAVTEDKSQQVKHLMTFLRIQVEAREESNLDQASSSASQRLHQRESRPLELNPPSAAALSIEVRTPYTRPCLLCNASDHTHECSTSLTSEETRRKLQARRRCFRCAKRNDVATEFRSARNLQCAHCAGQHLTSLCNASTPSHEQSKRLGNVSAPSVQRARESVSIDTPPRATSVSTSGTGLMPVFLQIGRAWAVRPARSILLRFLLDTGSQRTFVRRDVGRTLNCLVQSVERLTLFTFGKTHRPVTLICNRVSVTLRSQHSTNELTIDALEVPKISAVTSPPVDGAIITIMTHHDLVPTDARSEAKSFREDEISILIGSDFYWDVVTGHIARLSPQVTAVETRFGWTVQGTLHDFSQDSTVKSMSLVFGTGEPPSDDAPTNTSMTIRNYVKTQVHKRRPSGMNAGAQRSSGDQNKRKHTYCINATSSHKGVCDGCHCRCGNESKCE
ncbi:hypothetical protein HPB49_010813 [Dermacentor silvarum]|uniref:Uncharacterized protein n=1 Tax=Dermacentor silvarum TaxID=543639 RepID=A0ACB8CEK9_DERSI|nr:hypothetical protein HPB49_010813 [Dermacentor silvarum]